ncbi:amino acid permease [Glaciimonas sp. PCH181]|uniref:amino acid permease n=1 Tax=Glaciimonas sp. PCH181 TaxID=2133943 RepID=UPI000D39D456|nr:amino acid permease [Glaciimonas sp. PCH181]PUA17960.1 amino acid permease [Glaciimonas sp. PCH181]
MSLFRTKDLDQMIRDSQHDSSGLKRSLGALDLTLLGIGAIVGTGIFVLTGTGALLAGPGLSLAFLLAAVACGFAALCYAELASSVPVSGSVYTYSYATMGEFIAWMIGWDLVLEYGLAASTVAVGWSGYFQSLLAGFSIHIPAVLSAAPGALPGLTTWFNLPAFIILLIITALLSIGIRESAKVNNILVFIKIGVVVLFIVVGANYVQPANWKPFLPFGYEGVFNAAAVVFFAFIGFDAVASAAEEVKRPARDLPIGIIASLGICSLLYVIVASIMTGIVPYEKFLGVDSPVSLALKYAGQNWVAGFVDMGAIIGMTTVILVMSYGQTRVLFAMSRDGLLPKKLSSVHPRFATPFFATWASGILFAFISALVPLSTLAELVNIGTLMAFCLISIAVLVMRKTRPDLHRPFRCPGVPYVPIAAICFCSFLMFHLQKTTWIAFGCWLLIGLVAYFAYARKRSLLHPK